jgi:hypothetical protein
MTTRERQKPSATPPPLADVAFWDGVADTFPSLVCHVRRRPLAAVTGWLVGPFGWLYRRIPAVRRHGYLIAYLARKPETPSTRP